MGKKTQAAGCLAACFAAAFFLFAFAPVDAVVLYDQGGNARYAFAPRDASFTIRFLHSWARSPVDERFRLVSQDRLLLVETMYEDFGAGLPHVPESGGLMRLEGGKIRILGIDRHIPDLQVRVGRLVANHTLLYNGKSVPLSRVVPPGAVVVFRVEQRRRYTLWIPREAERQ